MPLSIQTYLCLSSYFFSITGTIESTENIYKYHMQIKEESKTPPTAAKVFIPSNSSQNQPSADQNSNTSANR